MAQAGDIEMAVDDGGLREAGSEVAVPQQRDRSNARLETDEGTAGEGKVEVPGGRQVNEWWSKSIPEGTASKDGTVPQPGSPIAEVRLSQ